MVRLTKIYTKTGDGGLTYLVGGQQVPKNSLRIEAYGTVDELNAVLGIVSALAEQALTAGHSIDSFIVWLKKTQNDLFNLGSDLATRIEDRWEGQPLIDELDVSALEKLMDKLNEELPALESFVLPGGGLLNAHLHHARTICRRAERLVIALAQEEAVGAQVVPYLNRLSDTLFVWSRWVSKCLGEPEVLWVPKNSETTESG